MGEQRERGPLVSVVIPTYFRNEVLGDAIESALGQTHEPVEVIVVDDSGTAHARPVVADYDNVTYIPLSRNEGAYRAREIGIEEASGAYIQLLDDDDVLFEEKFSKQLPLFSDSVGVVYAGYETPELNHVKTPDPEVRGDILEHALRLHTWPCNTATMLVRRALLDEILPFRSRHFASDEGVRIELALRTEFDYVDEVLAYVRDSGPDSLGTSMAHAKGRERVLEEFSELYAERPAIRDRLKRDTYVWEGELLLERSPWSAEAIALFARAAYHDPEGEVGGLIRVLASVFGRPGLRLGKWGWRSYTRVAKRVRGE